MPARPLGGVRLRFAITARSLSSSAIDVQLLRRRPQAAGCTGALSRTTNYTGVMNYMGARFSSDPAAMQTMLAELGKRGLLYFDDGTSTRSAAPEVALKNGVAFAAGFLSSWSMM